jgi:hypothetical protein
MRCQMALRRQPVPGAKTAVAHRLLKGIGNLQIARSCLRDETGEPACRQISLYGLSRAHVWTAFKQVAQKEKMSLVS